MARIVRLTERDLNRLVKRVIKEQDENDFDIDDNFKVEITKKMVLLNGSTSRVVRKVMSQLTDEIRFIAFLNCEEADFSNVDLCNDFPNLHFVNVKGTPNNLEETQEDCYELSGEGGYYFQREKSF
jgi:hypothetical protein